MPTWTWWLMADCTDLRTQIIVLPSQSGTSPCICPLTASFIWIYICALDMPMEAMQWIARRAVTWWTGLLQVLCYCIKRMDSLSPATRKQMQGRKKNSSSLTSVGSWLQVLTTWSRGTIFCKEKVCKRCDSKFSRATIKVGNWASTLVLGQDVWKNLQKVAVFAGTPCSDKTSSDHTCRTDTCSWYQSQVKDSYYKNHRR